MPDYLSQTVRRAGTWEGAAGSCALTYDERFFRRKVLKTAQGQSILVDLPETVSLNHGEALETEDGKLFKIIAADEQLYKISGPDLVRLAWHVGNRHTPCQINADHLLIQADAVIGHMLEHLGAVVEPVTAAFTPEGGAYGHGRTHSHAHGATAHDHARSHDHAHDH